MSEKNIFSLLFKWVKPQAGAYRRKQKSPKEKEKYCTEIVAILLSHLLNRDSKQHRQEAVDVINRLFAERVGFSFSLDDPIVVQAFRRIPEGIPDLTIMTQDKVDKLILIEIKVDSKVDDAARTRLKKYASYLSTHQGSNGLILLSKYGNESVNDIIPRKQQVSWFQVSELLEAAFKKFQPEPGTANEHAASAGTYLLDQFCQFLKEESMSFERVTEEVKSSTLYSIMNLFSMLAAVCRHMGLLKKDTPTRAIYPREQECFWGYKCNGRRGYHIGFYGSPERDKPLKLFLEVDAEKDIKRMFGDDERRIKEELGDNAELWKLEGGKRVVAFSLDLDSAKFFDKGAAQQGRVIQRFINDSMKKWQDAGRAHRPKRHR